ncbi:MAG: Sensor histidine kinase [Rhodocyclales bacterium]|nr:Sensor histidine kinase [Rhodocyclales bacterium]MDB5887345.1 Sensor histidine kinase [Rhodocyclales bacterium]
MRRRYLKCDDKDIVGHCARRRARGHFVRHHLYRQIYFGFMAVVAFVCLIAASLFWSLHGPSEARLDEHVVPLLMRILPASASAAEQTATLADISATVHGSVALYGQEGRRIASSGGDMPLSLNELEQGKPHKFDNVIILNDGRRLLLRWGSQARHIVLGWIAAVALLVAFGTWPVARRLTRRLERLQQQADAWGEGHLSARMAIDGCDEVAELARRFNQAAERVEALVNSQRAMLAAASHELRSPLARIRMATDLMGDMQNASRPDLHAQIARDIAELDALIGDLLLASRLAEDSPRLQMASVDLLGLAAEEASRVGASVGGEAVTLRADARLLRHLVRNLLDNARRYGLREKSGDTTADTIEVEVQRTQDGAVLRVLDRGPGVPAAEREKVFDPFYRLAGSAEHGEGTGYGLALVRRIARLHGGEAVCLSREGSGACFEVSLRGEPGTDKG